MSGELLLGSAKVDITPDRPIPLAGYAVRKGVCEGVNRRLYVRANLFETAAEGRSSRVLLVQADIIWWGGERMAGIRRTLSERFGLAPERVILSAQHTHGGPQTSERFSEALGLPDPDYLQELETALYDAVASAERRMEPVTADRGADECHIGVNRRKMVDGLMRMVPNPDGIFDPTVEVIRFRKKDGGGLKALFVHHACHPTTTNANWISSDYPGAAAERLEATFGCGTVVTFLQGCSGNVRPNTARDGKFVNGDEQDVAAYGRQLADAVERALARPMESVSDGRLDGRSLVVQLPLQPLPSEAEVEAAVKQGGVWAEWGQCFRDRAEMRATTVPLELTHVTLADGLSILAMDGEIVLEYGEYIKRLSGGRTLALGYSNGMIGYVPTAEQIVEGGYEGKDSGVYFMLAAPFAPETETRIYKAIDQLIGEEQNR